MNLHLNRWMCLLLLTPWLLGAQIVIAPSQPVYSPQRGQTFDVIVTLSQPIPQGLEGYHLQLRHPSGLFSARQILVETPEIDHGFLPGTPAERSFTAETARIQGFVDLDLPPYAGVSFLVFRLTLAENAPAGEHPLVLEFPEANCFINGNFQTVDPLITLGSATVNVSGFVDANSNQVPDEWELQFYNHLSEVPETVTIQNQVFTMRQLYLANLSPLGTQVPRFDTPTQFQTANDRVYDVYHSADLTDPDAWTLVLTHAGNGGPFDIPDPQPGFYKFRVRLP